MMTNMFASARIRLTLWYLLVILMITSTLSAIVYVRIADVLEQEYIRIEQRINQQMPQFGYQSRPNYGRRITLQDLDNAKRQIARQLMTINLVIVIIFAVAGYFFSGKTLKPIEEVHEAQKRFIGDAAHELKTPITALKTSIEVNLMDKGLSKQTRNILEENLEDVQSLESLSQSLLRLAKVSDQNLVKTEVDFKKLTARAVEYMEAMAQQRDITIDLQRPRSKLMVMGDEGALFDLILIILDNAIKYSPSGSVIEVSLAKKKNLAELSVTDYGLGISPEDLPHIFDRFFRAEQSRTTQQARGYGLGLSVAQRIVEQQGADLSVISQIGSGSTFTITIHTIN